ncbi:MAG: methionyl-tRNA formyltransferase, partial [Clostridia bacterium]|nr:methionyl-tRNA formyltransferase [Clostridia bacterium]
VACGEGCINITSVVPEGQKKMSAADFIRGRGVAEGDILCLK